MTEKIHNRVEVVNHSDEATVRRNDNSVLSAFQSNQRLLIVAVGLELSEDEIRSQVGEKAVQAMKETK